MRLALVVYSLTQLQLTVAAVKNTKNRPAPKEKPINWNLSYYSEPFTPCKTLRNFNPVERVRVHGVAVELFRKCGPRLIVPYATRYAFPAFAIVKAGEIFCLLFNVGGAYFGMPGQLTVKDDEDVNKMLNLLRRFCYAAEKGEFNITVTNGNQKFKIGSQMCHGFLYDVVECALNTVGNRNADIAKYAVGHYLKLLL